MMQRDALVRYVLRAIPRVLAVYAFGSRVHGTAGPESDLDMAVLVEGYVNAMALWNVAGELADVAGCPVDFVDLRAASTVMQYQIIMRGERWWALDGQADIFEAMVLSEKTELDAARAGILEDIERRGTVYDDQNPACGWRRPGH